MSKYANEAFSRVYNDAATLEVTMDAEWNNGTGYFDGAVHANLGLSAGQIVKAYTGEKNRRRLLIIGTAFGNVVVFDRYTDNALLDHPVFVLNAPRVLNSLRLISEGQQSEAQVLDLVGDPRYGASCLNERNIGLRLEALKGFLNDPSTAVRRRKVAA